MQSTLSCPCPRHLATPPIHCVRELGIGGVWTHWLHRIHGGEWATQGREDGEGARERKQGSQPTWPLASSPAPSPTPRSSSAACRSVQSLTSTWTSPCLVRTGGGAGQGAEVAAWRAPQHFSAPPAANATLRVQGTPPVQSVVFTATKEVRVSGVGGTQVGASLVGCGSTREGPALWDLRRDQLPLWARSKPQASGTSASMTTGSGT